MLNLYGDVNQIDSLIPTPISLKINLNVYKNVTDMITVNWGEIEHPIISTLN
jgi:hypothetical protein